MAMIVQQLIHNHVASDQKSTGRDILKVICAFLANSFETVLDWQARARERRQLLGLSDQALKDFGASRADAELEGSKPGWHP